VEIAVVPEKFALMKVVVQLPEGVAGIPLKVSALVAAEQFHHDDLGFAGKRTGRRMPDILRRCLDGSWFSFHPETALFRHGGVNLRACL
jgi:hypothetical protein